MSEGARKTKNKIFKKNLQKEKRFIPMHSRNERREAESARLTAKKNENLHSRKAIEIKRNRDGEAQKFFKEIFKCSITGR